MTDVEKPTFPLHFLSVCVQACASNKRNVCMYVTDEGRGLEKRKSPIKIVTMVMDK